MQRRQETNKRAVGALMNHLHLWNHVDGPAPEDELLDPSEISLLAARDCCQALARMAEEHGNKRNELATYIDEITEAVASIQLLTWESIRVDRFSLTPPELYDESRERAGASGTSGRRGIASVCSAGRYA